MFYGVNTISDALELVECIEEDALELARRILHLKGLGSHRGELLEEIATVRKAIDVIAAKLMKIE
jgi:hypothetical protein